MNLSSRTVLLAAAALGAALPTFAQQKDSLPTLMANLAHRADQAKANGNTALALQLMAKYDAIKAQLGGDEPHFSVASHALESVQTGPLNVVAPIPCGGGTIGSTSSFNGTTGPIADLATQTFTCVVSGMPTSLFDVDMTTAITHTYAADLDITLTSPMGTIINITHDNGGANDDVFNGTVWDDQSSNSVSSYAYVNGVAAPNLAPEQSFSTARNENPNGTWTLTVTDDAGIDVGNVNSWSLSVTTWTPGGPPSYNPPVTFTHSPNLAIPDYSGVPGVASDPITASGLGTSCEEVRLYTEITHTWNGDLLITLTAPNGATGTVSNRRGGSYNDVFNGTTWDMSAPNAVATYAFSADGVVTPLKPESNFVTGFDGLDPNGVWTLTITDNAGADVGVLARWDLTVITCASGPPPPVSYCTAGTTTNGCLATVGATNNPSISNAVPCVITVSNVEGQKNGIVFYGIAGPNNVPWATGSSSFLCVKPPTQRAGTTNSGGTLGGCNGSLVLNWDTYQASNPGALGQPWAVGNKAYVQGWFRDPAAIKTTNLSNGLELTYQP
jgi:subtilisin-like proprotein convertase family protein